MYLNDLLNGDSRKRKGILGPRRADKCDLGGNMTEKGLRIQEQAEEINRLKAENKRLMERDTAKLLDKRQSEISGTYYLCPMCSKVVGLSAHYCKNCGQKVRRE